MTAAELITELQKLPPELEVRHWTCSMGIESKDLIEEAVVEITTDNERRWDGIQADRYIMLK